MKILGMFARYPEPGQTKTRLAASVGDDAAAELYSSFVVDLLRRAPSLAEKFCAAVTPNDCQTMSWFKNAATSSTQIVAQPDGDLGDRIDWFFRQFLAEQGDRVILMGTDSPDLPDDRVEGAFEQLRHHDMVLVPACDGGFVLIGLKKLPAQLFANVRWSSPVTLSDMIAAAQDSQMSVKLLSPWYDVDTAENLGTFFALQKNPVANNAACPQTMNTAERLQLKLG